MKSGLTAQEKKTQQVLQTMVSDSKKQAQKQILETQPKSIQELEEYTEMRKKALQDPHVKKTNSLVQKQLEKNQMLLEKAQALQERLNLTNKKFQETQQRVAPAKDALEKRDLQNSKSVPIQEKVLYPNTIVQTSNPEDIKLIIEVMIANQKCQPIEEQAVLNYDLLFKDPDFGQNSAYNALYFENDLDKALASELEYSLKKIEWLRPNQIAPKPKIAGFTELNINAASDDERMDLKSQYKIHGHRIIQGKLEDRWFLSALNMVASEQKLFDQLVCREEGFHIYRKYGIYVFRFYKNSQLYYVIIDDLLPCISKENGQPFQFFARCENPNLFWVSLIEKAYAKLHGRYYSLQGGSTEEALQDLLGIQPETIYIDPLVTSDKQNLFNALRILSYNHCIIGCKLDFEMFPNMDADRKNNFYRLATTKGIQPRFYYTILDVREVKLDEKGADPTQIHRLVRLKNPWANSQEWNGAFNDNDTLWTTELKAKFNNMNVLDGYSDNERYIHRWNVEDGIFTMRIEDFMEMFNTIVVGRDFPDNYFGVRFEDEWAPSYGFPHPKNANWLNNKQYIFTFDNPMVKEVKVNVYLQQNDPRFISLLHPPYKDHRVSMGLIVLKMGKIEDKVKFYDASKKVLIKKPQSARTIQASFTVTQGKYCIIPLTRYSNDVQKYQLKFYFNCQPTDIMFSTLPFKVILDNESTQEVKAASMNNKDLLASLNNKFYDQQKDANNKTTVKSALPDRSTAALAQNLTRKSLYRSDNEEIRKQIGNNRFVWQVMAPFELETIVNPPERVDPKKKDPNGASELKRKQELMGDFYEDDENDFGCRLYDKDFDQMQAFEKNQILMGIDPEDPDETQKGKTRQQLQESQQRHQYIQEVVKDELDFSYYYLTQEGFHAILPQIEEQYFSWIKKLNLAGCALSDFSINELCMSLKQIHCQTIEYLDISDNQLTDQAILSIIDFCSKNSSLKEVVIENLPDVTQVMKTRLQTALKKNQMGVPTIDMMYQTAKQVDQALNKHLKFI